MPVAMEPTRAEMEEEKTWKPGYVRNLVTYFGKLGRAPSIRRPRGAGLRGSAGSLNKSNGSSNEADAVKSIDASKVTLNSRNVQNESITSNGIGPVASEPKTPSYVKLSCAVSGYKSYNNNATPTSQKQNGVDATVAPSLDNNNVIVNGGGRSHGGLLAGAGGEPVTLEYTPNSKNAYVKKVSQRFEQQQNVTSSEVSDNRNAHVTQQQQPHYNGASSPSSPAVTTNTTHLPHHTSSPNQQQQNSSPKSPQSSPEIIPLDDDNVDSDNINFSQAKQAFVHYDTTTQSDRDTTNQSASPQRSNRSAADVQLNEVSLSRRPFDNVVSPLSTQQQQEDSSSLDNHSNDVTDDATTSHLRHNDNVVTKDISITSKLDTPADLVLTDIENSATLDTKGSENNTEHLLATTATTHLDKTVGDNVVHINGDVVVNGDMPTVQRLPSPHSSSEDLDTPTPTKDGEYFLQVMKVEEERINALCATTEKELETVNMSEEVSGKVRAAMGKGHLLTTKKFKQFRGLCERNMTQGADESFRTTCQDLAGFWDMVLIQVQDVYEHFNEINKLRQNDWKPASSKASPLLSSKPAIPKTPKSRSARATPKSAKAQEAAKAREDARRKLIEAKKAGRRQRKTSENAEDIEINIVT